MLTIGSENQRHGWASVPRGDVLRLGCDRGSGQRGSAGHRQPRAVPPCPGAGTDHGDLRWIGVMCTSGAGGAPTIPAGVCLRPPCCPVPPAWRALEAHGTRCVLGAWGDTGPSGTELPSAMSAGPRPTLLGVSGHSRCVLGHTDSAWLSNPEISSLLQFPWRQAW